MLKQAAFLGGKKDGVLENFYYQKNSNEFDIELHEHEFEAKFPLKETSYLVCAPY